MADKLQYRQQVTWPINARRFGGGNGVGEVRGAAVSGGLVPPQKFLWLPPPKKKLSLNQRYCKNCLQMCFLNM